MNPDFLREMKVCADGAQVAAGCRLRLKGETKLDLRPGYFELTVYDLAPSPAALLSSCREVEIRSGNSVLARGERCDAGTREIGRRQVTEVFFSPGLSLWESACSLTTAPGLRVSDTVKELLRASGCGVAPAGYTAEDPVMSKAQSFFGRTADALELLAETAGGRAYLSSAGLVICGKNSGETPLFLGEQDLLSPPVRTAEGVILKTGMTGWPEGIRIRYGWKGETGEGRLIQRMIDADTGANLWTCELFLETE